MILRFNKLYYNVLNLARRPDAIRYLALVGFAEAFFFPIPVDVMLAPMVLATPEKAYKYARVTVIASVLGGMLGYLLGMLLFKPVVAPLLQFLGYTAAYTKVLEIFSYWGFWVLCLVGCIPLPYKLFTIAAGVLQFNIFLFIIASIIGRSLRYFIVSAILKTAGSNFNMVLAKLLARFGWVLLLSFGIAVLAALFFR